MKEEFLVRMVTSTEFWIGPTEVRLTQGNLIYVKAVGPQNYHTATAHIGLIRQFYQEINEPLNFLIDLNEAGKNSPEARKAWKDVSDDDLTCKVALVGIHPVARVIAGFVMSVSVSSKIRFFSTQEKALKWIYE